MFSFSSSNQKLFSSKKLSYIEVGCVQRQGDILTWNSFHTNNFLPLFFLIFCSNKWWNVYPKKLKKLYSPYLYCVCLSVKVVDTVLLAIPSFSCKWWLSQSNWINGFLNNCTDNDLKRTLILNDEKNSKFEADHRISPIVQFQMKTL